MVAWFLIIHEPTHLRTFVNPTVLTVSQVAELPQMAFPKAFLYLEETASSKVNMAEAISLAQELNDFHGLAAD